MTDGRRTRALVLLVDDSPTQAQRAVQALEEAGFRVRLAANGRQALAQARQWRPDVVVSDVLMPVMDGFALCREVRRDAALAHVPVVLHTMTYVDPKDEEFALGLGATRFLVKPNDPQELVKQVRLALATGHAAAPPASAASTEAFLQGYSERLAAKLEDKVAELEEAYRLLEERSQEQIRLAENKYQTLVEQLPVMTYIATLDTPPCTLYVSPQTALLFGFSQQEWLADPTLWGTLLHPDDRDDVFAGVERTCTSGERFDGEHRMFDRQGRELSFRHLAVLARDTFGRGLFLQGMLTDITAHRRADEERDRLSAEVEQERTTLAAVLASMTDGLLVVDAAGLVRYCNARVGALLGADTRAFVGADIAAAFAATGHVYTDPAAVWALWEESLGRLEEQPRFEVRVAGPPHDLEVQLFPVHDAMGGGQAFGVVLRDVTAERDLARAKDELVSIVSHELRTPLASIVGFAELLLSRDFGAEEQREFLTIMHAESNRLTGLINDFLDLQRMESGKQEVRPVPTELPALMERSAAAAGDDPVRPIVVDAPDDLPPVAADPDSVHQVLVNLLGNARKYSPAGGWVRLAARTIDDAVEISVTDQGLGIPPEALPKLFEKFYRVDSSDRRAIKGTGLGLAICRQIVAAHGGRIWAESAGLGHGSRIAFTLPLASTAPVEGGVLVVEDDRGFARLIETALVPLGLPVASVTSAEEALVRLAFERPRAIVLDLVLPGISGEAMLPRLHEATGPEVPIVVVVTAKDLGPPERAALERAGAAVVLQKGPAVATAAADAVRRILAERDEPPGDGNAESELGCDLETSPPTGTLWEPVTDAHPAGAPTPRNPG